MLNKISIILLVIALLFSNITPVLAQSQSDYPVYLVQSGDTLGIIAQKFGVPVNDLIQLNAIANPNAIAVGMPLKIPGLQGITGTLITQSVPIGETFEGMAIRYQVTPAILAKLNRVTSPQELYAGASLVMPQDNQKGTTQASSILGGGQSFLEASLAANSNPWTAAFIRQDKIPSTELPGTMIYAKNQDSTKAISSISPLVSNVQINPLPIVQGKTVVIRVQTTKPVDLSGKLNERDLHFFLEKENTYVALQGVYALATPGLASIYLNGSTKEGNNFNYQGSVILKAGIYPNDPPLTVDPETIDPKNTKPEEDQIAKIIAPATAAKLWKGKFRVPVDEPVCYKSTFGNRRSYNGGPYSSFHGGVDFGVCANLNINAVADGIVVFAGPLTVRGNAVIIDHGWGVYSGYWHQKEIKVKVGDQVKAGQLIGLIGATGRVTGPHLHWEMIVGGIQVEPVDWLEKTYP